MGNQDTPIVTNSEAPPASFYEPYVAPNISSYGIQHHEQSQRSHPEGHGLIALQQNDKSGDSTIPVSLLGRYQASVECPACSRRTVTSVKHKNWKATQSVTISRFTSSRREMLMSEANSCMQYLGSCTPFYYRNWVFVPYLSDYFKNVQHKCGRCGVVLATNHFGSGTEAHLH